MKNFQLILILSLLLPITAHAAMFAVEVDTGRETINAVEGKIILPEGVIPENIYTGRSAILIWLTMPKFDAETNSITFAGLTPGGFRGKHPLFELDGLTPKKLGEFHLPK